jgi:hypothetical protein
MPVSAKYCPDMLSFAYRSSRVTPRNCRTRIRADDLAGVSIESFGAAVI